MKRVFSKCHRLTFIFVSLEATRPLLCSYVAALILLDALCAATLSAKLHLSQLNDTVLRGFMNAQLFFIVGYIDFLNEHNNNNNNRII